MNAATLFAAFKMPPTQAVEFLRSKGVVVSDSWMDVWRDAHARAFTVAQTAGSDVVGDIRDALVKAVNDGETFATFNRNLEPTLVAKGWWGKAIDPETGEITKMYPGTTRPVSYGTPARLKLIYQQNVQTAYMAGRYRGMMAAVDTHPYWQYTAVMDSRTRPAHAAMHGRIFRFDDPAWGVCYPPCGWNCRCRAIPMSAAEVQRLGLPIESAAGHIEEVPVLDKAGQPRVLPDGRPMTVRQIRLPDMPRPFRPDPGWDYNAAANYPNLEAA
ncbi:phage head morphogenesis protein [Burkholderia sp. Ac-20345]|uniref:phage head morphogenesis protein n=1 Tax=Burkholderia sp. Ac-20345 TaxID=2703891 RepID=UPI00197B7E61|nr:phage minor head protein [Burkholderia sp. Ac-20345]MBN3779956.1 phage head morphogenesis protein [Burkholderia sp. Ac-20345]